MNSNDPFFQKKKKKNSVRVKTKLNTLKARNKNQEKKQPIFRFRFLKIFMAEIYF